MRCNNHGTDLSSIIGVCASCLRERLFTIILSQQQQQSISQPPIQSIHNNNNIIIPTVNRSVSPYASHRKSLNNPVTTAQRPYNTHSTSEKRFYNSPHIAITTGGCIGSSSINKKPTVIRFPSISNLFRSNSRKSNGDADTNHRVSVSRSNKPSGAGGRPSSVTPCTGFVRKQQRFVSDRGMSPVRTTDDGEYSDGSTESCKQTAVIRRGGGQKSVREMILCPLVSGSPNRRCGYSGDVRAPIVPHISYAKSLSGNRSRKLVDFGRPDPNR